ncbi:hypothetical protein BLOT_015195 [Blomia tropicalis]|nr:hypothetical protein BLOT_015195 [Blomia tropicalis]
MVDFRKSPFNGTFRQGFKDHTYDFLDISILVMVSRFRYIEDRQMGSRRDTQNAEYIHAKVTN